MCKKGSRVTKRSEGSSGWLLTSLLPRYGCPRCFEPSCLCSLGSHSESCTAPGVLASTSNAYRLRRPEGYLSKPVLHDISGTIFYSEEGPRAIPAHLQNPRSLPQLGAGRAHSRPVTRRQMWHLFGPLRCGGPLPGDF